MGTNSQNNPESGEQVPFIRETVIPKPRTPWWKKLLLTVLLAILFGLVAAAVFFLAGSYLKERFFTDTGLPAESIVFPADDPDVPESSAGTEADSAASGESSEAVPPQDSSAAADESSPESESLNAAENESGAPTEAETDIRALIDKEVRRLLKEQKPGLNDYKALYSAVGSLVSNANRSMVTVIATNRSTDSFNTEYSYDTETFGIVVAITAQEVLILTPQAVIARLAENSSLSVRFGSGPDASAYTKATDAVSGLAVLAVPTDGLDGILQGISALPLGSSMASSAGQPVIALGAPAGSVGSVCYGILSHVEGEVSVIDNAVRLLHTDMQGADGARGILIDLDGNLIGWLDPAYQNGFLTAVGISDLKSYIQNLSNGIATGYLGICGQSLTVQLRTRLGLKEGGVFISDCVENGPALAAGIQNGDILVSVSDQPITDLHMLRSLLLSMNTEQTVRVGILRKSGSAYQPLSFDVRIERR